MQPQNRKKSEALRFGSWWENPTAAQTPAESWPPACFSLIHPLRTCRPGAQRPLSYSWNTHTCLTLRPGMVFWDARSWWAGRDLGTESPINPLKQNDGLVKEVNTKR